MTDNTAVAVSSPAIRDEPQLAPRLGLWILTFVLAGSYGGIQLAVAVPVLLWLLATHQIQGRQDALDSPLMIWGALIGLGLAAIVTVSIGLIWPRLWQALAGMDSPSFAGWLAWSKPEWIPLWAIPPMTIPLLVGLALVIDRFVGSSTVNPQLKLFASPGLRMLASVTVTTAVPVAEELIFRGALFNALLPPKTKIVPGWQRNVVPVVVTSVVFAALHRLAGIESFAEIAQITVLSFYLSMLRAVTGSVKSSIVAHVTWNALGAIALSASSLIH